VKLKIVCQQNNPPTMPVTHRLQLCTLQKVLSGNGFSLMGVSDGILPLENNSTTGDQASIDEERRLFYVGITRAKSDLRSSYRGQAIIRFLAEGWPRCRRTTPAVEPSYAFIYAGN